MAAAEVMTRPATPPSPRTVNRMGSRAADRTGDRTSPLATSSNGGGTEFSDEGWSVRTSFDVNAQVNASNVAAPATAAAPGSSGPAATAPSAAANSAAAAGDVLEADCPDTPCVTTETAAAIAAATASSFENDLQAQLQEWFHDSDWVDEPPSIHVSMGSGAVCHLDCVATVALPPDAVFNVVQDPHNRRVFKNIKAVNDVRVVRDDGDVQHIEMNMTFVWRLPALTGSFTAHVLMIQDRPNRMLSFELTRPGFMKKFQGFWKVEPLFVPSSSAIGGERDAAKFLACSHSSSSSPADHPSSPNNNPSADGDPTRSPISVLSYSCPDLYALGEAARAGTGAAPVTIAASASAEAAATSPVPPGMRVASRIVLQQIVQPSVAPPPIFRKCLQGILETATRDMLNDFQREAARIRTGEQLEEEGKEAREARERAERRTASFLHRETLRVSKSPSTSSLPGLVPSRGKKTGMNLVKDALSRSKKGLTSLAKAGAGRK